MILLGYHPGQLANGFGRVKHLAEALVCCTTINISYCWESELKSDVMVDMIRSSDAPL